MSEGHKCFWPRCSDKKRCNAHGSCVALAQAGGKSWPKPVYDVGEQYRLAEVAVGRYNPGAQPDIAGLMRSAFIHGYAQALIDQRKDMEPPG
jgi:hypothetical protein